jgi:hypothetical protein
LWFWEGELLLNHDEPSYNKNQVRLCDYLKYGNDFKYWLDFKNIDLKNVKSAFIEAKNNIKKAGIDMKQIYIAPFVTNYDLSRDFFQIAKEVFGKEIQFAGVVEKKENLADLLKFIDEEKISYLSIFHELINEDLIKKLAKVELFVWTVNDINKMKKLEALGIKNFITDIITPQIYEKHATTSRPQSAS